MARISGKPKVEFCLRIPSSMLEIVDRLVAEGWFAARSEAIMYALYRLFFEGVSIACAPHEGPTRPICFRVPRRFVEVLAYDFGRWGCGSMSDLVRSALADFLRAFMRPPREEEDGLELLEGRPISDVFKYRYMDSHV